MTRVMRVQAVHQPAVFLWVSLALLLLGSLSVTASAQTFSGTGNSHFSAPSPSGGVWSIRSYTGGEFGYPSNPSDSSNQFNCGTTAFEPPYENPPPAFREGNMYRMTGVGFTAPVDTPFVVSDLLYRNAQVYSNTIPGTTDVTLPLSISMTFDQGFSQTFNFNFHFTYTLNSGNREADADYLRIDEPLSAPQTFSYQGRTYRMTLLGFKQNEQDPITSQFKLYENEEVSSRLWAEITGLGNNTVITAAPPIDYGRVIKGQTPTGTITVSKTGTDSTTFGVTTAVKPGGEGGGVGGISVNPTGGAFEGSLDTLTQDLSVRLENNAGGSAVTGKKEFTVTVDNLALDSSSPGRGSDDPDDVLDVKATVVEDRQLTATAVNFGRMVVGGTKTAQTPSSVSTTGDDDHFTRVTLNGGTFAAPGTTEGDIQLTIAAPGKTFDDALDTATAQVRATFSQSGRHVGTATLTPGSGGISGEGLIGESVKSLTVGYEADVVERRSISTTPVEMGRVMVGVDVKDLPSARRTSTLSTVGADEQFTRLKVKWGTGGVNGDGLYTPDQPAPFDVETYAGTKNGSRSLRGAFTSAGEKAGQVSYGVTGETEIGDGPYAPLSVGYTATAVRDRQLQATDVQWGRMMKDVPADPQTTTITTTGTDDQNTRITLAAGTHSLSTSTGLPMSAAVAGARLFDDPTDNTTATVSSTFSTTGRHAGTATLSPAGGAIVGEGLLGESVQSVSFGYEATVVERRQITASDVSIGRVMVGVDLSGLSSDRRTSTLATTGDNDHYTQLRVQRGSGGANADGIFTPDVAPPGDAETFSGTGTSARALSGAFATAGNKAGSVAFGVTGEGLTGEGTYDPLAVGYTATAVGDRQLTATPANLGKVFRNASANGSSTIGTVGDDSVATRVTLAADSYPGPVGSGVTASVAATTTFNASTVTAPASVSGTFSSAGYKSGSVTIQPGTSTGIRGEGLLGENVRSLDIPYTAEVYDHGVASFSSSAPQTSLTIDFGTLAKDAPAAVQGFSFSNLVQTLGYTGSLDFLGVSAATGDTAFFSHNLAPAPDIAAGATRNHIASMSTQAGGVYSAQYTLLFDDAASQGIVGPTVPQTLTLTLRGQVEASQPIIPPITVPNPGFEAIWPHQVNAVWIQLQPGDATSGLQFATSGTGDPDVLFVPSWDSSDTEYDSDSGVRRPAGPGGSSEFSRGVVSGFNVGYVRGSDAASAPESFGVRPIGTMIGQALYELSFKVGRSDSDPFALPSIELLYGEGSELTVIPLTDQESSLVPVPGAGEFAQWKLYYFLPEGDPAIGAQLFIRVTGSDSQPGIAYLDDFHLGSPMTYSPIVGDLNGDGLINLDDVEPFILALNDRDAYLTAYGQRNYDIVGDIDGNGMLDFFDLHPFCLLIDDSNLRIEVDSAGRLYAVILPEPSSVAVMALSACLILTRRRSTERGQP